MGMIKIDQWLGFQKKIKALKNVFLAGIRCLNIYTLFTHHSITKITFSFILYLQIDDCRRTHNYDEFICTFLSMLAKEGHLANLIDQQMSVKKRHNSGNAGRPTKHSLPVKGSRPKPKRRR